MALCNENRKEWVLTSESMPRKKDDYFLVFFRKNMLFSDVGFSHPVPIKHIFRRVMGGLEGV